LSPKAIEWHIHTFKEIDSTQRIAKNLAADGAPEGTVVVAETQSEGRGRAGRRWFSPPGGLWLSAVFRPTITPTDVQKMTLAVGVAATRAIVRSTGLMANLKWPNDVQIGYRKVCGILTEASVKSGVVEFLVVGVGINANVDLATLPPDLRPTTTSLKYELKREIPIEKLTNALLLELQKEYASLSGGLFAPILADWRALTNTLGNWVEVQTPNKTIDGFAEDLDHDGALILRLADGSRVTVIAGDALLRRKHHFNQS